MKVEIGNPATSRRSNIRNFYLVEDAPNDHNFPHHNTKLTPAGYQLRVLKLQRSRSLTLQSRKPSFVKQNAIDDRFPYHVIQQILGRLNRAMTN